MSDEGIHEIQLNGKQLVFLFMAATVVAVVIFLCGVMVGRGVPTRAAVAIDDPRQTSLDPTAAVQEPRAVPAAAGSGGAPATTEEDLTYPALLRNADPPVETLRPAVEPTADIPSPAAPRTTPARAPRPVPVATPTARAPRPVAAAPVAAAPPVNAAPTASTAAPVSAVAGGSLAEPPGTGFVVQVAAVRQRAEANTIARRLSTKGYPAFVTTAGANFRVRVGKYDDRSEAESVAGRLEKEERFKPWITR